MRTEMTRLEAWTNKMNNNPLTLCGGFQHLCSPFRPLPYLTWPVRRRSSTGLDNPMLELEHLKKGITTTQPSHSGADPRLREGRRQEDEVVAAHLSTAS